MHADHAEVNVNFWLTPDEANLDTRAARVPHACRTRSAEKTYSFLARYKLLVFGPRTATWIGRNSSKLRPQGNEPTHPQHQSNTNRRSQVQPEQADAYKLNARNRAERMDEPLLIQLAKTMQKPQATRFTNSCMFDIQLIKKTYRF